MSGSSQSTSAARWTESTLPRFVRLEHESVLEAVERDLRACIERSGEFPSIARYDARVDPSRDADAAESIVLAALDAAPRFKSAIARGWSDAFPAWKPAIERALAVAMLSEDELDETIGADEVIRVGAPLEDGFGRYELIETLGTGASGRVYRAVDRVLSQCGARVEVAVKIVPCTRGEVEQRIREAGAARAISDSGVARVLDAGTIVGGSSGSAVARALGIRESGILIATELIDGVPLYVWKALHPARTGAQCALVASRIESALASCHAAGVAHGDLSPANIMVDREGAPRIVDFGHASWSREAGVAEEFSTQTARDRRRLEHLRVWLVRDLSDAAVRAETQAESGSARVLRRRNAAVAVLLLLTAGGSYAWWSFVRERNDPKAAVATLDPTQLIFGSELSADEELEGAVRGLLEHGGVESMTEQDLARLRSRLRIEAADLAQANNLSSEQQARLLGSALVALSTGDAVWAAPQAVLAASCAAEHPHRMLLAQVIADLARRASGDAGSEAIVRASLTRLIETTGASGLEFVLSSIERQGAAAAGNGAAPRVGADNSR